MCAHQKSHQMAQMAFAQPLYSVRCSFSVLTIIQFNSILVSSEIEYMGLTVNFRCFSSTALAELT
jgi:hypothetical protein